MVTRQSQLCRYHYDPLDRLAKRTLSTGVGAAFFYCQDRLNTQVQGASQYSVLQVDDRLLAQLQNTESGLDISLLATDLQRSVLEALEDGQRHAQVYTAYGHPADSGLNSLPGFAGERSEPATGHYLLGNGYRAFNPVLMRFNSPDNLSPFEKGGLNAYAYCQGDPVNRVDADGHFMTLLSRAFLGQLSFLAGSAAVVTTITAITLEVVAPNPKTRIALSVATAALVLMAAGGAALYWRAPPRTIQSGLAGTPRSGSWPSMESLPSPSVVRAARQQAYREDMLRRRHREAAERLGQFNLYNPPPHTRFYRVARIRGDSFFTHSYDRPL